MLNYKARRIAFFCFFLLIAAGFIAGAQNLPVDFLAPGAQTTSMERAEIWKKWDRQAERTTRMIASGQAGQDTLASLRTTLDNQRTEAKSISDAAAAEITRLTREQDALGPPPEAGVTEPVDVAKLRGELSQRITDARAVQSRADRVIARAEGLVTAITGASQRRFIERLTTAGVSPANPAYWPPAAEGALASFVRIWTMAAEELSQPSLRAHLKSRAPIALVAFLFTVVVALGLHGFVLALMRRVVGGADGRGMRLLISIGAAFGRLLTLIFIAGAVLVGLITLDILGEGGRALLGGFSSGAGQFIIIYALGAAYFSPNSAPIRVPPLDYNEARIGFFGALIVALALFFDRFADALWAVTGAPDETQTASAFIALLTGAFGLWRLSIAAACVCEKRSDEAMISYQLILIVRRVLAVIAIAAPTLALVGYEYAARFLFFPFVYSTALVVGLFMLHRAIAEAVDIRIADRAATEPAAPGNDDDDDDPAQPRSQRLRLISLLAGIVLIGVAAPLMALFWGASVADLQATYRVMSDGVLIGDAKFSPIDILLFISIFIGGYMLTRAVQRLLKNTLLPHAGISRGGADALAAGFGYLGVIVAAIIAVAGAGIDLSNLAIVAGALSVGIGFGLQNVVNNFVSGLILLIERPVKTGDWIEVGGVHGYVRKVNVRSTEIETFDRSSYILPNSDLISGAVTNFTLADKIGRVICPVHVAHGTDTRKVERILLEVGRAHPMVVSNPAPVAYFLGFGESALEFDLRVMIRNINWLFAVRSELNHEISARLRDAGIIVPYPQRDLHIRSGMPAMAGSEMAGSEIADPEKAGPKMDESMK